MGMIFDHTLDSSVEAVLSSETKFSAEEAWSGIALTVGDAEVFQRNVHLRRKSGHLVRGRTTI